MWTPLKGRPTTPGNPGRRYRGGCHDYAHPSNNYGYYCQVKAELLEVEAWEGDEVAEPVGIYSEELVADSQRVGNVAGYNGPHSQHQHWQHHNHRRLGQVRRMRVVGCPCPCLGFRLKAGMTVRQGGCAALPCPGFLLGGCAAFELAVKGHVNHPEGVDGSEEHANHEEPEYYGCHGAIPPPGVEEDFVLAPEALQRGIFPQG